MNAAEAPLPAEWPMIRMPLPVRRYCCAAALALAVPFAVQAQSVRGVVVDAGDRPVSGVVVLLVDSASNVAARALSAERGEFRVAATRAGTYRLRTLRIGFRPVVSAPMTIAAGEQVTRRLVLTGLPETPPDPVCPVIRLECDRPPVLYLCGGLREPKVPHPHYDPCPSDILQ